MKLISAVMAVLLSLALPAGALAMPHGGTFTAKYVDGANVVVLNYNAPDELKTGTVVTHNLRLYDLTGQPVLFERVQTTFERKGHAAASQTTQLSPNNDVNLRYSYPQAGSYTLKAQFIDHDKAVAQAEFPLVVTQGPGFGLFTDILTLPVAAAFLLGIGAAHIYSIRKTLKLPQFVVKFIPKQLKRS